MKNQNQIERSFQWMVAGGEMGEGELRKVVTSEGLGVGERRDLRLLPAPTTISSASLVSP